jgi:ABC-2 type transport system permease protein
MFSSNWLKGKMKSSGYYILLKKEVKELFRSGKLIVFAAVFLFFGLLSPVAAKYLPAIIGSIGESQKIQIVIPEPTWLDAVAQYLKNLTQLCTFIIIIIFMGMVSREKESGTAVFLLVKPVSRGSFLLAKYSSTIIALVISLAISFVAASIYTYLFFEGFPIGGFIKLNLVMLLYLAGILFMTVMFSSILRSQIIAGVFTFLGWMLMALISQFGEPGKFSPSTLISQANSVATGGTIIWQPFAGVLVLMAVAFILSYLLFRKWEA